MNVNETETNKNTLEKVIDERAYDLPPAVTQDCVNEELVDRNQNDLIEKNESEVYGEVGEISVETENEDVIHNNMNVNET